MNTFITDKLDRTVKNLEKQNSNKAVEQLKKENNDLKLSLMECKAQAIDRNEKEQSELKQRYARLTACFISLENAHMSLRRYVVDTEQRLDELQEYIEKDTNLL